MKLNGVMIGTEDPKGLAEYYTRLFGAPEWDQGDFKGWQIGDAYLVLGPHDEVKGPNAHPGRLMWNLETPDVRGEFDRLRAAGAIVVREPYAPDGGPEMVIATLADPEDNYFQLVSPM